MGTIVYDREQLDLHVDDRLLAHLQIVIINKLRKGDSFLFSWRESQGEGRSTAWLSPQIGLRFRFAGSRSPDINLAWLRLLYDAADSGRGLYVIAEPPYDSTQLHDGRGDPVDRGGDASAPPRRRKARPPVS